MSAELRFKKKVDVERGDQTGTAFIRWGIELELREWGVKGLSPYVSDQPILVTWVSRDENDDEVETTEELSLSDCTTEFDHDREMIYPQKLEYIKGTKNDGWVLIF